MSELHEIELTLAVLETKIKQLSAQTRSCIQSSDGTAVNRIYELADSIYGYSGLIRNFANTIIMERSRQEPKF